MFPGHGINFSLQGKIHTGLVIHDYIFPKDCISSTILFQDLKRNVDALEFVFFSQMFQDLTKQFHRPSWTSQFDSHMKCALLINLNETFNPCNIIIYFGWTLMLWFILQIHTPPLHSSYLFLAYYNRINFR